MTSDALARRSAEIALLLAVGALIGWQLDIGFLRAVIPDRPGMKPIAAVAFLFLAAALRTARSAGASPRTVALSRALAAPGAIIGLLVLTSYVLGSTPGVQGLFVSEEATVRNPGFSTWVSAPTGLCLLLLGAGLMLLDTPIRAARAIGHTAAILAVATALLALTGHAFRTTFQAEPSTWRPLAFNSGVALLAVGVGVLAALKDYGLGALLRRQTAGGALARRLLPPMVLTPLVLTWLRYLGEEAGWFDRVGGGAVLVTVLAGVLGAIVWRAAVLLDRADVERRRAEAALRESEERYRLLFEANPEPCWVFDIGTLRFLAVNDAAVRRYGYTPDEFRSMTLRDIRPAEDVPRLLERVGQLSEAGVSPPTAFWRHHTKDGRVLDVEVISHVLTYQGQRAELVLAHDVTERLRSEAALRASEEAFRTLAVTANDAIISADAHGIITYFNPAAERIFDRAAADMTGQPLTILMPERFREAHQAGMTRYLSTGEGRVIGRTVELAGLRRDGTEFPLELSLASWRHDREVAFTAVIRDITVRREVDEALKRYAAQLEVANAELDAFAYSVSHDLRAPLRSIDGFSLALLEDSAAALDETGRDYLNRVRRAAQRMAALIDDLLGLSRVTRAVLQREAVDLSGLAAAITGELRSAAADRSVDVTIEPGLTVEGDPRLLRILLENLLGNAWKYTSRKPHAQIAFGRVDSDGSRTYYVRDDGAGFDMAYAGSLFGPFQRLHSAGEFEGTGIGLATVQRIVHRHGGRVWAEGAVGRGATFYFTL